jgi:hypothetical protein
MPETDNKPPFEFGQTVWIARAHPYAEKRVPCPICFGKRSVVLILGNGEHQPVECQGCGLGFEGPRGYVRQNGPSSEVCRATVTGLKRTGSGWEVSCGDWGVVEREVFGTEAEAEARRVVLHREAEKQADRNFESQFKRKKKDHGWTVRHHNERLKDLRSQIEWLARSQAARRQGEIQCPRLTRSPCGARR